MNWATRFGPGLLLPLLWAPSLAATPRPDRAPAPSTTSATSSYVGEVEAWRQQRLARLKADGGWLTLAGLFWLKPGPNTFGSAPDRDMVLPPSAPPRAGVLTLAEGKVSLALAPAVTAQIAGRPVGKDQVLRSDGGEQAPDVVALGPAVTLQIIERAGRLGVRVKDAASPARASFKGLPWYPVDPSWRVKARFIPHATPTTLVVPSIIGTSEPMVSPGTAELVLAGKTYRLVAVQEPGESKLFFIFRDATSGKGTYGAGRFLYAEPPQNGEVILDFNQAYSPPCAFTPYATCPLPPSQNRLPLAVPAGERYDGPPH